MRAAIALTILLTFSGWAEAVEQPLKIVEPVFRQYDGGPLLAANHAFLEGENVVFGFQIAGFKENNKDAFKLRYQILVSDKDGVLLVEPFFSGTGGEISEQDRKSNWMPRVNYEFQLPTVLPRGQYFVHVSVTDEIANAEAKQDIPFPVNGPTVELSDVLAVRDFRFLRSERDGPPLNPASYRPGDPIWARFEITGYKTGEKNEFQVDFGLSVTDTSGKVLYTNEPAAEDSGKPFYPQKYVKGLLNLTTQKNTPTGSYTLVLTVHDRIGNQVNETRYPYRLE